jgi:hypothetical protein
MKKLAGAALLLALATAQAAAQESMTPMQIIEQGQREERARVDQQYEAARRARDRAGTDATAKVDPWASVRPAETAAKPARKKPRSP